VRLGTREGKWGRSRISRNEYNFTEGNCGEKAQGNVRPKISMGAEDGQKKTSQEFLSDLRGTKYMINFPRI